MLHRGRIHGLRVGDRRTFVRVTGQYDLDDRTARCSRNDRERRLGATVLHGHGSAGRFADCRDVGRREFHQLWLMSVIASSDWQKA